LRVKVELGSTCVEGKACSIRIVPRDDWKRVSLLSSLVMIRLRTEGDGR
jgi:hypothetical protein